MHVLQSMNSLSQEVHEAKTLCCILCGRPRQGLTFKNSHVCDKCVKYVKSL